MTADISSFGESFKKEVLPYINTLSFPNTMLIEGGSAELRLSAARFIAQSLLCVSSGAHPCGVCPSCVKCEALSHPDMREYGDISSDAAFKVEACRAVRSDCFVLPNDGDKKVYILKEVQNMNDSGENALLKIFEEPPSYVYFIMTCPSRSAMLDTVLSRATVFSLGSENDSSLFDEDTADLAQKIAKALLSPAETSLLAAVSPLEKDRAGFKNTVLCLKSIFLDAVKIKLHAAATPEFSETAGELSSVLTADKLYRCCGVLDELFDGAAMNQNQNLLLTSLCYKLREAVGK